MSTPSAPDVAVVGAGIVGVACAEWLRRDGHRVTLIDRNEPGEGTSHGNAGILARAAVVPVPVPGLLGKAPGMLLRRDGPLFVRWAHLPRMLPWLVRYLRCGRRQRVEEIAGALAHLLTDCVDQHLALARGTPAERWISTLDYVYLYRERAHFEAERFAWRLRGEHGIAGQALARPDLLDLDAHLGERYRFGYRLPDHGHIKDPGRYVKDLAAWFTGQGGTFVRGAVRDIRVRDAGVEIEHEGGTLHAARVVLATGAWSARLASALGHRCRLESERGYHVEYDQPDPAPPLPYMLSDAKLVFTPMHRRLRGAGLVEFGGLEAPPGVAPLRLVDKALEALYPAFRHTARREWLGHRPSTPDSLPLLGRSSRHPAVFFAFGHQHVGLTSGPKSGRIVADLVAGRPTNVDLAPYAVDRFD